MSYSHPLAITPPPAAGAPVAWMLRRRADGFIRSFFREQPAEDLYLTADAEGDEIVELHAPGAAPRHEAPLEPVHGDQLPPVGSKVLIHLASCDAWVEHTVAGYYVWGDLDGNDHLHRVFVRVRDAQGYLNARLLKDVRPSPPSEHDSDAGH